MTTKQSFGFSTIECNRIPRGLSVIPCRELKTVACFCHASLKFNFDRILITWGLLSITSIMSSTYLNPCWVKYITCTHSTCSMNPTSMPYLLVVVLLARGTQGDFCCAPHSFSQIMVSVEIFDAARVSIVSQCWCRSITTTLILHRWSTS